MAEGDSGHPPPQHRSCILILEAGVLVASDAHLLEVGGRFQHLSSSV
jgi:hypothetical protein